MSEFEQNNLQVEQTLQGGIDHEIPTEDSLHQENAERADDNLPAQASPYLEGLIKELEKCHDTEAKLQCVISFMEAALAQSGTPHFRSFWDSRKLCLPLFKGHISPPLRVTLWEKYTSLSKEARRLKEVLNEQSAFAEEQISIAIDGLEADVVKLAELREQGVPNELPIQCQTLEPHQEFYNTTQGLLSLLNASAARINALRKELIKTEMRIRKKNQIFQKLSAIGDAVFPLRKDLIKQVSDQFIADVDNFIKSQFDQNNFRDSIFNLREEIKTLQGMAKILTLNAHAFTQTRLRLSECWDRLKGMDKERKQQRAEQRAIFQQNAEEVLKKIQALEQEIEAGALSLDDSEKQIGEIVATMRRIELGREELQMLRTRIEAVRKPLTEKRERAAQERLEMDRERTRLKQQKLQNLKDETESLINLASGLSIEELTEARESLLQKIQNAEITRFERDELERVLRPLRDIISDKKEQNLMSLSENDRQTLQQLRELLKQRKERRQEMKDQIETLRKSKGASGLGFEQAMARQVQLDDEKERLEKLNHSIKEIEEKIEALEDQ